MGRGLCSAEPPAKPRALGGCDVRAANAPQRIEEEVPFDPRKKLDVLKKGLMEIGVDEDSFERAWGRMAAKYGDLNVVVAKLRDLITVELEGWRRMLSCLTECTRCRTDRRKRAAI